MTSYVPSLLPPERLKGGRFYRARKITDRRGNSPDQTVNMSPERLSLHLTMFQR